MPVAWEKFDDDDVDAAVVVDNECAARFLCHCCRHCLSSRCWCNVGESFQEHKCLSTEIAHSG